MKPRVSKYQRAITALRAQPPEDELGILRQQVLKAELMLHLTNVADVQAKQGARFMWVQRKFTAARLTIFALLALTLSAGTVFASEAALPGTPLYSIKKLKEQVELNLAASGEAKAQITVKHAEKRLDELVEVRNQLLAVPEMEISVEDKARQTKAEERAKYEVKTELKGALEALSQVQSNLSAAGNVSAAANVAQAISGLEDRANQARVKIRQSGREIEIEIEDEDETEGDQDNNSTNGDQDRRDFNANDNDRPNQEQAEDELPGEIKVDVDAGVIKINEVASDGDAGYEADKANSGPDDSD